MPRPPRVPHPSEFKSQAEAIDGGALYLLPIEIFALEEKIGQLDVRQKELGKLLGDAMNESSETYHDNAPAEVINNDSTIMIAEFALVARALRNAERIAYPQDTTVVSIGNLVTIAYSDTDHERVLLTGHTSKVSNNFVAPNNFEQALAARSPMGRALLEAKAGDEVRYKVDAREFQIGIIAIDAVQDIPTAVDSE